MDGFFESYYRLRPVNATFIGRHEQDHALPDLSAEGVAAVTREAAELLAAAEQIDRAALSPVERLDQQVAEGFLRIQQWEAASEHFYRGNPSLALGELTFGVIGLLLTEYAPAVQRAAAAAARLRRAPDLLRQARALINSAPLAWTEKALDECAGARALFARGVAMWAEENGVQSAALEAACAAALAAVEEYAAWLDSDLRGRLRSSLACGEEAFALLLREGHFLEQSPDEVAAYAEAELAAAQAALEARAHEIGAPNWRLVVAALVQPHPSTDGYLARFQTLWQKSRVLAGERALLTWPDFPIRYVPQPRWAREAAPHLYFLFYRAPAAFDRPPVHDYLVTPIEHSMSPHEQMRRLQANNESVIKLNHVVHHGGIGHHVQNWNAYHGASRIGRVAAVDCAARIALFCGGTMAEGWACYATTLMQEAGFLTAQEEVGELHGRVRMAARALVDVRLHQGRMTLDEAAAFYQENTAMSAAASRGEAVKNSMFPAAAVIYLLGHDMIMQLRADMQARLGSRFSPRAFHDALLSYGSLPVALVGRQMRAGGGVAPLDGPFAENSHAQ